MDLNELSDKDTFTVIQTVVQISLSLSLSLEKTMDFVADFRLSMPQVQISQNMDKISINFSQQMATDTNKSKYVMVIQIPEFFVSEQLLGHEKHK